MRTTFAGSVWKALGWVLCVRPELEEGEQGGEREEDEVEGRQYEEVIVEIQKERSREFRSQVRGA